MPSMAFAPEYVRLVLHEIFEDAKTLFLASLRTIDYAHLVMLVEQGIVTREDGRRLRDAMRAVTDDDLRAAPYDTGCEDLFFYVSHRLADVCGDVSGHLHTARSRNDIDMTMYRMRVGEEVLELAEAFIALRDALVPLAAKHTTTIFAAHTHTQPAQPTTLAHYLLGVVEQVERDHARFRAAYETVNRCPLGACAITGTGFPIDRERTSHLLGFDAPTGNTYGSIATVDYLLEALTTLVVGMIGLGRVLQDLLLWCTAEVGYVRLGEGFVQCSSIMPQKRNPVALEHARALASKAVGQAQAATLAVHNTPFGDVVDTEDDLQPLVHAAFRDAIRATGLTAAALADVEIDVARMRERAGIGWTTVTELADTLTRAHGVPFQRSHHIAARLVAARRERPWEASADALKRLSREVAGCEISYEEETLRRMLTPEHFVSVRRTRGGPAPDVVAVAIADAQRILDRDRVWIEARRAALGAAGRELRAAVEAL
ncbi:MAG: argininosuccinate lyase [Luteitalea sp.]|nr:argininosuccinate lyase [Luteitalea sp.]